MKSRCWLPLVCLCLLTAAPLLAQASTPEATEAAPSKITIHLSSIEPEGVEYDAAHQRFLIGSLADGKIRQVADDGTASVFIDDQDLDATAGIQIDTARNRLLVVDSGGDNEVLASSTAKGKAVLAAYDLDSRNREFYVDLGALTPDPRHFANDVAVDADGNAYVTDSLAPVIYKVDADGNGQVFLRDDRFSNAEIGLNGIDYVPAGYLLVAQFGDGKIYKVPLNDPSQMTEVNLPQPFGADGMVIGADGLLYTVAYFDNGGQSILALSSSDDWATATVKAALGTTGMATTLALRDGIPYYINSYLNFPQWPYYDIVRANLKPR